MCGIVGHISRSGEFGDETAFRKAVDMLDKRGPDDGDTWCEGEAMFGHRRLAIIDLSATGHQPMLSHCERYVIVFNGEIYNFKKIREELSYPWRGTSDTETILAAYAAWGPRCLDRFHGMFAFAIWDRHEKVLFAARDRMGVKPFYYHHSASRFIFSSRPRVLFHLCPELSRTVDVQALRYYLEGGYIPAPYSIHESIRKLPPAHFLIGNENGVHVKRYWDFRSIEPLNCWAKRDENDLLDELDEIVGRSVSSRMISDVPLGAFLSGGIDSSLVVALMAKRSSLPVKTFTIGFSEKVYDESCHAQAVAEYLGTDHHCEYLHVNDLLKLLPTFQEEFDEPFFDSSAFPVMAVSRLARQHVTVSLSGDGGDELFGGYHYYQIAHKLNHFYDLPAVVRSGIARLVGLLPQHKLKLLAGALRQKDRAASFAFSRSISKDFGVVLDSEQLVRTSSLSSLFSESSKAFPDTLDPSEQGMRLDAFFTLPDDYLQKVDVASMSFSLESREPFLDHDLIEWAMKLPIQWKLREGVNKYLLRKLAYRYVPKPILDRPKQGFGVPIDDWLRGPLKEWAEERLYDRNLFASVPLDQGAVLALWKMHGSCIRNVHPLLWAVLMFLNFHENHGTLATNS